MNTKVLAFLFQGTACRKGLKCFGICGASLGKGMFQGKKRVRGNGWATFGN